MLDFLLGGGGEPYGGGGGGGGGPYGGSDFKCKYDCGFAGSFDAVARHEVSCPLIDWTCKNGCGYKGLHPAVQTHERTCGKDGEYECTNHCGFRGSFAECANHETNCGKDGSYRCKTGCGFFGQYLTVERHERECGQWECKTGCGFKGTHAVVADHELWCHTGSAARLFGGGTDLAHGQAVHFRHADGYRIDGRVQGEWPVQGHEDKKVYIESTEGAPHLYQVPRDQVSLGHHNSGL